MTIHGVVDSSAAAVNPWEQLARAKKVRVLVAVIDSIAREQHFPFGPLALATVLEGLTPEGWAGLADRAHVHATSPETVALVVEHYSTTVQS